MTNEEMFIQNQRIAYKVAKPYYINNKEDFEDIKQVALLGLWKAVLTYNKTYAFSTYAYRVIANEINYYLRKNRKHNSTISIYTEIGNEITIADTLLDSIDYIEQLEAVESINNGIKKLQGKEKAIFEMMLEGKTQQNIAKKMQVSQPQISRIAKKIKEKLKEE